MSILTDAELAELRAQEEGEMLDTLTFRLITRGVNEDTGFEEPTGAVLFTTPGLVRGRSGGDPQVGTVDIGGVARPIIASGLKIPVSAPAIPDGVVEAEVTAVGPATDPNLLGQVFRLVGYGGKSWATARRLDVVEV